MGKKNMAETDELSQLHTVYEPLSVDTAVALVDWYRKGHRELPWRSDPTAYHVWVSEIMLQQTRVEAVKPYYARFLGELPDIRALAETPEDRLLKLWEGLGYYNRVRNMQKAAKVMTERYGGQMPASYEEILALPGIGSYTAGAIGSIAFGLPVAAVDGNVLRVLSRLENCDANIDEPRTKKQAEQALMETIRQMTDAADPSGEFNQAMMELGAMVCVPNGMARCDLCPVADRCAARRRDRIMELPVRKEKRPRRIEKKTILLVVNGSRIAVNKRDQNGLLAGLYEFPGIEGWMTEQEAVAFLEKTGAQPLHVETLPPAKHVFSHIEWHMKGYYVRLAETEQDALADWLFVGKEEIDRKYAIPSAFGAYKEYLARLK